VRIAHVSRNATGGVLHVARDTGLLDRYGIDADLQYINSPLSVTAMLAGEVDVHFGGAEPIIASNLEGAETLLVACGTPHAFWWVMAKPAITQPQDLRGRRVANSRRGSNLYAVFNLALPYWGLEPDDVTIAQIETDPEKIQAVMNDAADAAVLGIPANLVATARGLRPLVNLGDLGIEWPSSCLATTRPYAAEQPAAVKGVLQAYVAATQWMKGHKDEAVEILMRFTGSDDRAAVEEGYNTYVRDIAALPFPSPSGLQTILTASINPAAANAKPEQFVDNRFVRDLETSGFLQSLTP
jgi:NitT/TauT family transport system substrate-binding protein